MEKQSEIQFTKKVKLVSIIIPAHNSEGYIEACITSCLKQTHEDLEILVIDDGSTDATVEVARMINSPKIRILQKSNGGAGSARNYGIDYSTGDYLMFLDADDVIHEDLVSEQLKSLEGAPHSVALCNWVKIPSNIEGSTSLLAVASAGDFLHLTLRTGLHTQTACWLYPRYLIKNVAWSERRDHPDDDAHFTAQILAQAPGIRSLNKCFVYYREHDGDRLSAKKNTAAWKNRLITLEEQFKAFSTLGLTGEEVDRSIKSGLFTIMYLLPSEQLELIKVCEEKFRSIKGWFFLSVGSKLFRILAMISPLPALKLRRRLHEKKSVYLAYWRSR